MTQPIKIYVAAKFEDKERVRAAYAKIRARGHTITHDWTKEDDAGLGGDARRNYHRRCAEADVQGVLDADAVILLDHPNTHGADIEVGIAIGHRKPVVVVDCVRHTIFYTLDGVALATHDVDVAIGMVEGMVAFLRGRDVTPPGEKVERTFTPDTLAPDVYQRLCARTVDAKLPTRERACQLVMGLCGEAGETSEVVKKHLFHDVRNVRGRILEETGDVLWYAGQLLREFGLSLEDAMRNNLEKTRRRRPVGLKVRHRDDPNKRGTVEEVIETPVGGPMWRLRLDGDVLDAPPRCFPATDLAFLDEIGAPDPILASDMRARAP